MKNPIVVIILLVALGFGGVWAYKHFMKDPQKTVETTFHKGLEWPKSFQTVVSFNLSAPEQGSLALTLDFSADVNNLTDIKGTGALNLIAKIKQMGDQEQKGSVEFRQLGSNYYVSATTIPPIVGAFMPQAAQFQGKWFSINLDAIMTPVMKKEHDDMVAGNGAKLRDRFQKITTALGDAVVSSKLFTGYKAMGTGAVLGVQCDHYQASLNYDALPDLMGGIFDILKQYGPDMGIQPDQLAKLDDAKTKLPKMREEINKSKKDLPPITLNIWLGKQDGRVRKLMVPFTYKLPENEQRPGGPKQFDMEFGVEMNYDVAVSVTAPVGAQDLTNMLKTAAQKSAPAPRGMATPTPGTAPAPGMTPAPSATSTY